MYNDPSELISIDELCDILSIGRNSAYQLLNTKKLKLLELVVYGKSAE